MTSGAPDRTEPLEALLSGYRTSTSTAYDEVLDTRANLRPHWHELLKAIGEMTPAESARRIARIDRKVRETGIDFDIFAHPNTPTHRWRLDLLPIVISAAEFRWLSQALGQRARLMDAILRDIYGDQRLLSDGALPAELVYSDETYLPACRGLASRAGPLRFFAADLARDAKGQWRVIDSHAETLAGIGFAIANRVAHSHVTGDVLRRVDAVRIASFFQNLQTALAAHAGRDGARIALLTPGPQHQDYFSHAYLARYLGFLLVEGPDLRIKGNRVHLKTLEGLKEIDLVIRCVDGRLVDALELDPSGMNGPAGLLRVNRINPHLVLNPVGSAIVQNRGLSAYLPELSRKLLGADLLLPDARRRWLGAPDSKAEVLAHLPRYVVRKVQEGTGRPGEAAHGIRASRLSEAARAELAAEIALNGAGLVAEEEFGFSHAPVITEGRLEPRPFAIRFYVTHTGDGYEVMPGGLAMSVDDAGGVSLSATDGHTRDVWVLAEGESRAHVSLWKPMRDNARIERSQRALQSRVADDLFWLGRYHERADWVMRVLRSALRRVEEDSGTSNGLASVRKTMLALLEARSRPAPPRVITETDIERLAAELIAGRDISRSLVNTCEGLYRCANLARDRLSFEAWDTLSRFRPGDALVSGFASSAPLAMLDLLDEGLAALAAFNGFMHENMTRNYGWSFIDLGRRIERAYNLSESIHALFVQRSTAEEDANALRLILELADSFITYRSRYRIDPSLPLVLDLLLLDETNPRALAFQLAAIVRHLEGLPDAQRSTALSEDRRLALAALTAIRLADVAATAADRGRLGQLLTNQLEQLPELSDAIGRHYFNLIGELPHRVATRREADR